MYKSIVIITVVALCLVAVTTGIAQQNVPVTSIQNIDKNARIDWSNLVYVVEGHGALPSASTMPNRAQAMLKARDYAKMDALANLQMAIEGTTISYDAIGRDYMADVIIRQKIEGFVKNAEVISYRTEKYEGDTIVIVKMKAPMFGQNAPGGLFLPGADASSGIGAPREDASKINVVLNPDRKNVPKTAFAAKPSPAGKPYTGVILDAIGYNLQRAMSPAIRRTDGSLVWDGSAVSPNQVIEKGIAAYTTSLANARKHPRVGSNPLIIRCVGRAGGFFSCDPVISDADAKMLLNENAKGKFLDNTRVVIIKDPVFK